MPSDCILYSVTKHRAQSCYMQNPKISSFYLTVLVLFSCICACTKEKSQNNTQINPTHSSYDTLFPLDYFPVFPGSYWKYVDTQNNITVIQTDTTYQKDYYTVGAAAFVSDTFYVPIYNGTPIWRYKAHTGSISHSGSTPLPRILSDSLPIGSQWVIYSWTGTQVSRRLLAKDTSIEISNHIFYPTIVVEEFYSQGPTYNLWIVRRYYTQNIGLIKEERYNVLDSTISSKELVDYFIND